MTNTENIDIDLVYLWVDGNDNNFIQEKDYWAKKLGVKYAAENDIGRFANNDELKYSLRSIIKNLPWLNKIFIVTNGQIPNWFNLVDDRIKIITHKEIMPNDALPTFDSTAIESCIDNIPGLSEYFIWANDDFFVSKPLDKSFFFDDNNNPKVYFYKQKLKSFNHPKTAYKSYLIYANKLIKERYNKDFAGLIPYHNLDAYRKSYIKEVKEIWKEEFEKATKNKFRTFWTIHRYIYQLYMIACKNVNFTILAKGDFSINIYMFLSSIYYEKYVIERYSPKMFCFNDGPSINDIDRENYKYLLYKLFPIPTKYEKPEYNETSDFKLKAEEFFAKKIDASLDITKFKFNKFYLKYIFIKHIRKLFMDKNVHREELKIYKKQLKQYRRVLELKKYYKL